MRKMMVALAVAMGMGAVGVAGASAAPMQAGHLSDSGRYSQIVPADYYHDHHHYQHRHWEHDHHRYY